MPHTRSIAALALLCAACAATPPVLLRLPPPAVRSVATSAPPPRDQPAVCARGSGTPQARLLFETGSVGERGLVFTPQGDLLAFDWKWLQVHDRATGALLESIELCDGLLAVAFRDDHHATAVCEKQLQEVTLPGLAHQPLLTLPPEVRRAAAARDVVAVGTQADEVVIYHRGAARFAIDSADPAAGSAASWREVDRFRTASPQRSLILSADGALLAVGEDSGQIEVRHLASRLPLRLTLGTNVGVDVLAFSPDGHELLVEAMGAKLLSLDKGARPVNLYTSGLRAAAFLSQSEIAGAGETLALLPGPRFLPYGRGFRAIAASGNALVCAVNEHSKLSCFSDCPAQP